VQGGNRSREFGKQLISCAEFGSGKASGGEGSGQDQKKSGGGQAIDLFLSSEAGKGLEGGGAGGGGDAWEGGR